MKKTTYIKTNLIRKEIIRQKERTSVKRESPIERVLADRDTGDKIHLPLLYVVPVLACYLKLALQLSAVRRAGLFCRREGNAGGFRLQAGQTESSGAKFQNQ
jgi:hypothetical protein